MSRNALSGVHREWPPGAEDGRLRKETSIMWIELKDKERKYLIEFAQKQHDCAKDNVGTRTPIHLVERMTRHFVEDGSDEAWLDADNEYAEYDSFGELIEARNKNGDELPSYEDVVFEDINDVWICDYKSYCEAHGINAISGRHIETYQPVAFFLIRDEAKRYRDDYQKHNCQDCRIFTYSLGYANKGDFPVFRALLMDLGKQLIAENTAADRLLS